MNMEHSNDPDTLQKLSRAAVEELRRASKDLMVTTGKVEACIVKALKKVGVVEKVEKHDKQLKSLFKQLTISLSGLIHFDEKVK